MESYRYLQFLYLIIPLTVGIEFFLTAQQERRTLSKESAVAIIMDAGGYVFTALIPALFLFTIFSLSLHRLPLPEQFLHRMDRYGVMFFFLGAWWQIFLITGLRARRAASAGKPIFTCVWCPYLALGLFVSALILWTAPSASCGSPSSGSRQATGSSISSTCQPSRYPGSFSSWPV